MLNRRHIRIKVMQIFMHSKVQKVMILKKTKDFLLQSMDKMS